VPDFGFLLHFSCALCDMGRHIDAIACFLNIALSAPASDLY